jgi:hypothetical protein
MRSTKAAVPGGLFLFQLEFPGRKAREPAAPTSVAKFDPMLVNAFGICAWAAGPVRVPASGWRWPRLPVPAGAEKPIDTKIFARAGAGTQNPLAMFVHAQAWSGNDRC